MGVKQTDNGTWEVSVWYRDWQGGRHRKHKRGFKTKKEAVEWERSFLAKQNGAPDMTFEDFVAIYKADRMPHLRLNTWKDKENIIQTKIMLYFGQMKLSEIPGPQRA